MNQTPGAPSARRRVRRFSITCGLLLLVFLALGGCTSTVQPPSDVGAHPVSVWLVRDARHRGLILPSADGQLLEFGYGEYAWYAEMRDAWYRVFPAALWPTPGTLGVRRLGATRGEQLAAVLPGASVDELVVARDGVESLRQQLLDRFAAAGAPLWNGIYGFDFVPDPAGYWCLFNCNDAVADWLVALGCRVSWVPIRLDLEVVEPGD